MENNKKIKFSIEYEKIGSDENFDSGLEEPKWRELAKYYFNETEETKETVLKEICDRLAAEPFSFPAHERFYTLALRAGGGTADGAVQVVRNYFKHLNDCPQYFRSALPSKMGHVLRAQIHTVLPHRDQYGRRVYIYRPGKWEPNEITFAECYCVGYMMSELVAREAKTQIAGVVTVINADAFRLRHLTALTINDARNSAKIIQDSFPLWFREIHVVNAPRLFFAAYALVRPFLSQAVQNSIHFHGSNMQSLHEHVSSEILPEELGGTQGPFDNYECVQALNELEDYFKEIQAYGIKS